MSDFSYQPPDERMYHKAIVIALGKLERNDLVDAIGAARCVIANSGTFSNVRWNGMHTTVTFEVPMERYAALELDDDAIRALRAVCNNMMPTDAGLDVTHVVVAPRLDGNATEQTLEQQLDQLSDSLGRVAGAFPLPDDVIATGREMADAYLYLYAVENYLRLFIDKVCVDESGSGYPANLMVPVAVAKATELRKQEEAKNAWLGVRGDSDLFYLDFKDLGDVIVNNWDTFKSHFPNQAWISSKIKELGDCRNLVAHNSVLGEHQQNVIKTNFTSILMQLNPDTK